MFVNGAPWQQQSSFNTTQSGDLTGTWTTGVALPGNLAYHSCVFIKNYVWAIGGTSATSTYRQYSYRGTVDSSGVITSWTTISNFPFNRAHFAVAVVGSYVYVLGGYDGSADSNTILRATITNGTIGTFATYGSTLPVAVAGHKCAVIKSKLYIFGGGLTSVYVADIQTDGSLGEWVTAGSLSVNDYSAIAITSSKVYLIGATGGINYSNEVWGASINPDGTLGTFTLDFTLTNRLGWAFLSVVAGSIYIYGGRQASTTYLNYINRLVLSSGVITSQADVNYYLPTTRHGHDIVVTSSRVYVIGGIVSTTFQSSTLYTTYAGGSNDYTSRLEETTQVLINLGTTSINASSSTSALTASIINAVPLASTCAITLSTSVLGKLVDRQLLSTILSSSSTTALTKICALLTDIPISSITSNINAAAGRPLQSTLATLFNCAIANINIHRAYTSTVGTNLTTSSINAHKHTAISSNIQALSSPSTLIASVLRPLSSVVALASSDSAVHEVILRHLNSSLLVALSGSSLSIPSQVLLNSSWSIVTGTSILRKTLATPVVSTVQAQSNTSATKAIKVSFLETTVSIITKGSVLHRPSVLVANATYKVTKKSSTRSINITIRFMARVVTNNFLARVQFRFSARRLTYGIII